MLNTNNPADDNSAESCRPPRRPQRKITPGRLKNIALYYLQRFESSAENLRGVLHRRIEKYARENPEFDKTAAYQWAEDILADFERLHYLDDARYAELKVRDYLAAGKPARYIQGKLKQKGIADSQINEILAAQEYDQKAMALRLAQRKKIGPYRPIEQRREQRQKDMGTLIRAGFDYDVVCEVLDMEITEE